MKAKLKNRIEHLNVPNLTREQKRALQRGEVVDLADDTAKFLVSFDNVTFVAELPAYVPKKEDIVKTKKFTDKKESD